MVSRGNCSHADKQISSSNIHCLILRENHAKWDFCINQNYCRALNQYTLKPECNNCSVKLKQRKDGDI